MMSRDVRRFILIALTLIAVFVGIQFWVASQVEEESPATTTTSEAPTTTTTPLTIVIDSTTLPPTTVPPTTASPTTASPTTTILPPEPEPVATPIDNNSVWDELAYCETGGVWNHPPVSIGYSGGLMFHHTTWGAYGGEEFASSAHHASREQQITVAERIRSDHGGTYRAWPGCRAKLGLP